MGVQKKTDDLFESIRNAITKYKTSKESIFLTEMTKEINKILDVEYSLLWKFEAEEKRLISIGKDSIERTMDKSLLYQTLQKKVPMIENHLISHKFYVASIDNPLAYHLKSMLIYPFVVKKNIIGFLVIAKKVKSRGFLERDLYVVLKKLQSILAPFVRKYRYPKSEISELPENDMYNFVREKKDTLEIKSLEEKVTLLDRNNRELQKSYKESIKQKIFLLLENIRLKKEIKHVGLPQLREDTLQYEKDINEETIKKLQISEKISQKQVNYLESKVKILQEENSLFRQQKEPKKISPYNIDNMAQLLPQLLPTMGRYVHTYMLYEFIMYESQVSNMRMFEIEEKIKKSKILWELFKCDRETKSVPLCIKPIGIEMFISKLEMFQVLLLDEQIHLDIQMLEGFPPSIMIDSEKVLSTCFHLIHDIRQFVDTSEDLNIILDYVDSVLTIYIRGKKHESLYRLLNKKKFTAMVKERTGLMMAKKLVGILSGELESYMDEVDCIHQFSISISAK